MNRKLLLGSLLSVFALALFFAFAGMTAGQATAESSPQSCACAVCCEDGTCCCDTGVCNCESCKCNCCSEGKMSSSEKPATCASGGCSKCKAAEAK